MLRGPPSAQRPDALTHLRLGRCCTCSEDFARRSRMVRPSRQPTRSKRGRPAPILLAQASTARQLVAAGEWLTNTMHACPHEQLEPELVSITQSTH
jgi:hypothetical protein